jgi:hypothetical protein
MSEQLRQTRVARAKHNLGEKEIETKNGENSENTGFVLDRRGFGN